MFFERPAFLALLLLALPWIHWLRRQEARAHAVGGLEPFRRFEREAGARRRGWPWALLCALGALTCAALALARPGFGGRPEYLLLDRSLSARSCGLPDPPARGRVVLEAASGLLELLAGLPAAARAEVWTDLRPPADLPARFRWNDEAFQACAGPNAAILGARPVAERRWSVHWQAEAGTGALQLVSDAGDRVAMPAGEEGVSEIEVGARATRLEIQRADGAAPDRRSDHDWRLDPGRWSIPADWDARWERAAAAALPGFRIQRAPGAPPAPFAADPLAELTELEAVAWLAARLRAASDAAQPPRPAAECRAAPPAEAWFARPAAASSPASGLSRAFGWAGAVLLLLACLACVIPLRRSSASRGAFS